ncbi:DUF1214 domain-containing protein [Thalassomonas sp. M1454]|uniref:DUF1214 domain-containing protein n=1 Tax=Thalassomonas sp. M1454 TaxID=2594477 RepID=UPI00117C500F|nr:DUF1214 domain-containing protein [Thalassomonas sp. M1454]TRX54943.1 DUF1214 domain-containing protein [Thalassomonas sp. M1454]
MNKLLLAATISASLLSLSVNAAEMTDSLKNYFSADGVQVTEDNYPTLETSRQLVKIQDKVGVNKFDHKRLLTPTDAQPVVRMNRDTYYSFSLVDVSEGAYVTLPEVPELPGGTYMSLEVVTEDHRVQPMVYGPGKFNLTTHNGDHVYALVRLDARFSVEEANALQDKMKITAKSNKTFYAEQVNHESFEKVENGLKAQMPGLLKSNPVEATFGMFTAPTDNSKELFVKKKYAVGAAIGWGGAQLVDNVYEVSGNYPMDKCHQMTFEDPENKAFWSVTVYNKKGFMFGDLANLSSNTAKVNKDGTYTVSFGCGADAINNIPTKNDTGVFNIAMRHYVPSDRVRNEGYRLLPFMKQVNK